MTSISDPTWSRGRSPTKWKRTSAHRRRISRPPRRPLHLRPALPAAVRPRARRSCATTRSRRGARRVSTGSPRSSSVPTSIGVVGPGRRVRRARPHRLGSRRPVAICITPGARLQHRPDERCVSISRAAAGLVLRAALRRSPNATWSGHRLEVDFGPHGARALARRSCTAGGRWTGSTCFRSSWYYANQFNERTNEDNVIWSVDAKTSVARAVTVYGSLLIDDFQFERDDGYPDKLAADVRRALGPRAAVGPRDARAVPLGRHLHLLARGIAVGLRERRGRDRWTATCCSAGCPDPTRTRGS